MGAAGSVNYTTIEEAKAAGKSQDEIDTYLSAHPQKEKHKVNYSLPGVKWCPPSMQKEAIALKSNLQLLQDQLASTKSWTVEQRKQTQHHLTAAKQYLDTCKNQASHEIDDLKQVRAKLEKRYVKMYAAMTEMIMEDPSWTAILEIGQKLKNNNIPTFCQSRNGLVPMYEDAVGVKPTFEQAFGEIAHASNGIVTFPSMKRIFRALEKTAMKQNSDPNLNRADNVCDVVRGMITYDNFTDMLNGIKAMENHKDIVIMRTKCRFSKPTSGGWMDHVSNLKFSSDRNSHVCEIQFVHKQLLVVRQQLGGHEVYNYFRSAMELLEVHGLLGNPLQLPKSKPADSNNSASVEIKNTEPSSDPIAWLEKQGVRIKVDLSSIFQQLNVTCIHDLALLNSDKITLITNEMKKNNQKKWVKKNITGKLQELLTNESIGPMIAARSSKTVKAWLTALSLNDDSGLQNWLEEEGYEDELEDLKGLEKNDIAALLQATAEVNKIRVERALGIVRAIKVPEEVESLEEAVKKARGSDGKIDTISIGEIELTISDSIELDFPVQIIGIGPTKTIVIGTDVQDGFKIISAKNNVVSHIQNLTIKDTDRCGFINSSTSHVLKLNNVNVTNCVYGITAEDNSRIEMINCNVSSCKQHGLCLTEKSTICISGPNTKIEKNCTDDGDQNYGICCYHDVSTVLIMKPLTKVIVAVDNKGGGNVGGEGTIMEWAPLQIPTVIHVPEECGTLKNAIQRASLSCGEITTIELSKGTHTSDANSIKIDFPLSIVGSSEDASQTILQGFGLLIEGTSSENQALHHPHLLVANKNASSSCYCDNCRGRSETMYHCNSGCNFDLCGECMLLAEAIKNSKQPEVCLRNLSIHDTSNEIDAVEVVKSTIELKMENICIENSGWNGISVKENANCDMVGVTVKGSQCNGIYVDESFVSVSGDSKIFENCTGKDSNHYGLKSTSNNDSVIHVMKPLTLEMLASNNFGGGNWGGGGTVASWSTLLNPTEIRVPEESDDIVSAMFRVQKSGGKITTIWLAEGKIVIGNLLAEREYIGRYPVTIKYNNDKTIVKAPAILKCTNNHSMKVSDYAEDNYVNGYICDICRQSKKGNRWFCLECCSDLCFDCHPEKHEDCTAVRCNFVSNNPKLNLKVEPIPSEK